MRYLRYIFLPFVVSFLIFALTCLWDGRSAPQLPSGVPWDKVVHFVMFFTLSAICFIDYYLLWNRNPTVLKWIFWCFVIPVLYGGAVELMQKYFFPPRSGDWMDFYADLLGSLTATMLALIFLPRKRKQKKNISL